MDKRKFNRVAADNSQLQMFVNEACDEINGGGGSMEAPIFDATLEEKEGKITVNMSAEDRNDIYANKYAIIGIRLEDVEDPTQHFVLYFKLRQHFVEQGVLAYDNWDSDTDDNTISHLNLVFMWDGDDAKIMFTDEELELGGGGGSGATKKEIDLTDNGDEWTQAQLEDVYTNKYDIVNVVTSSNTTVLRKVSEYQGFGVIYWTFVPQQGIVIYMFTYDEHDGYAIQTENRMPLVTMNVDGSAIMNQDQDTLKEIYEKQPDILYVDAGNDGEQSYRKQYARDDTLTYSCFIPAVLASVKIIEDKNVTPHTYSISIERYDLSSLIVNN